MAGEAGKAGFKYRAAGAATWRATALTTLPVCTGAGLHLPVETAVAGLEPGTTYSFKMYGLVDYDQRQDLQVEEPDAQAERFTTAAGRGDCPRTPWQPSSTRRVEPGSS